ncbi:hypothetical protein SRHO_G00329680 [Serrasalmus rhombeus]
MVTKPKTAEKFGGRDFWYWLSSHWKLDRGGTNNSTWYQICLGENQKSLETAFRRALLSFPAEQRGNGAAEGVSQSPGAPNFAKDRSNLAKVGEICQISRPLPSARARRRSSLGRQKQLFRLWELKGG